MDRSGDVAMHAARLIRRVKASLRARVLQTQVTPHSSEVGVGLWDIRMRVLREPVLRRREGIVTVLPAVPSTCLVARRVLGS